MIAPPPTALRTPAVMSTAELASWAQIGKNAVPRLVAKFGIKEITGSAKNQRFGVHDVMRKIIGVAPETPEDLQRLLMPLQKAIWVAQITGQSVSAINAAVCEKRNGVPFPIELTATSRDQAAARGRRWIPSQVEAHLHGNSIPFIPQTIAPTASAQKPPPDPRCNVFAAICGSNAEVSRQLQL